MIDQAEAEANILLISTLRAALEDANARVTVLREDAIRLTRMVDSLMCERDEWRARTQWAENRVQWAEKRAYEMDRALEERGKTG